MSFDSRHSEARFSPNATDSLCLLVAQVPRPRDMAIFVLTTTTTTRPITLPPCACARGNNKLLAIDLKITVNSPSSSRILFGGDDSDC